MERIRQAMRAALEQCAAEAWHAKRDGAYGFTFIATGSERRLVHLSPGDPSVGVGTAHSYLGSRSIVSPRA